MKFKSVQVIQSIFSDHSGIKLEINDREIAGQSPNNWKLTNIFLYTLWVIRVTKGELECIFN